jgi:hypothetical protein
MNLLREAVVSVSIRTAREKLGGESDEERFSIKQNWQLFTLASVNIFNSFAVRYRVLNCATNLTPTSDSSIKLLHHPYYLPA